MVTRSIAVLTLFVASACQASAGVQAQAKSMNDVNVDADANSNTAQARYAPSSGSTGKDGTSGYGDTAPSGTEAMLGARAGLRVTKPTTAKCQCLGVVVGSPTDPGFSWEGPVPKTNPATQLVVGLSSEGLPCPAAAADSLGASYHGYEIVGADVIVQVETARLGRPIAQGAIVPKPPAGGQIFVSASDAKSPYGRSPDGASRTCNIWTNP